MSFEEQLDLPGVFSRRLIALYSPGPQMGKSTIAKYLAERHGFVIVKFAEALKDMTRSFLSHCGYNAVEIEECVEGPHKETQLDEADGLTARELMISLGADQWLRDIGRPGFWCTLGVQKARYHLARGRSVVVEDMRRNDEMRMLVDEGAAMWKVLAPRRWTGLLPSEGHLDQERFDRTLMNDGDLARLYRGVEEALR